MSTESNTAAPSGSEPERMTSPTATSLLTTQERKPRKRRVLSRRGCFTCKARKVKCDEGRPACRRCVAAGRTCEGYGVWGGGGTYTSPDHLSQSSVSNPGSPQGLPAVQQEAGEPSGTYTWTTSQTSPPSIPTPAFEDFGSAWFGQDVPAPMGPILPSEGMSVPVSSLSPGSSAAMEDTTSLDWLSSWQPTDPVRPFYNDAVHNACQMEPLAVSAVAALSPYHQGGMGQWSSTPLCQLPIPSLATISEPQVGFLMHQYSQAIDVLRSRTTGSGQNNGPLELTLVSCVLLVSVELLQGSTETAFWHLHSGLRVLENAESSGIEGPSEVQDWILASLRKIYLQFELLHLFSNSHPRLPLPFSLRVMQDHHQEYFNNEEDAWTQLQGIIIDAVVIYRRAHETPAPLSQTGPTQQWQATHGHDNTFSEQASLLGQLDRWHTNFRVSFLPSFYTAHHHLMLVYRSLISALVTASTEAGDEMVYDRLMNQFRDAVTGATISMRPELEDAQGLGGKQLEEGSVSSVADLGFAMPLYVTAMKCRNRSIRQRAIQLLEMEASQNAAWASRSACAVAKAVMRLEGEDVLDRAASAQVLFTLDPHALVAIPNDQRCSVINILMEEGETRVQAKRGGEWVDSVVFLS